MRDHLRWESDSRYYEIRVSRDLFDCIVVGRYWGGRGSARGGSKITPFDSADAAARAIARITRTRLARGYRATLDHAAP